MSVDDAFVSVTSPRRLPVVIFALVATIAFVLLRVLAARHQAIPLTEPEELLNLRLARQLHAGLPLGPQGAYWYTGVGGPGGAGTWVLSWLYVPVVAILGEGIVAVRAMGILWGATGAALVALLARRLFGPGGGVAALVCALAMPPAWVTFTVMAKGNYVEAAVLGLAAALALLRSFDAEGGRSVVWMVGAAATATFSTWFWPSAVPPTVALAGAAVVAVVAERRYVLLPALASGAALGALPFVLGPVPLDTVASQVGGAEVGDVARKTLATPSLWPAIVHGSLAGQPLLSTPTAPAWEWASPWQLGSESILRGIQWAVCIAAAVLAVLPGVGPRLLPSARWDVSSRAVLFALSGTALALPILLGAMGVGPSYLPVRSVYFFDPRRAALVYPVWALVSAGALTVVWRRGGRFRLPLLVSMAVWIGLQAASAAAFSVAGQAPRGGFHPERWLICPAEEPRLEVAVCVGTVDHPDVPVLEALVADPRLTDPVLRRAALSGYGALEREDMDCSLPPGTLPTESPPDAESEAEWMWQGLGIAARGGCSWERVQAFCGEPTEERLRAACLRGAEWRVSLRSRP